MESPSSPAAAELLLATGNRGKVREMRAALAGLGLDLLDLSQLAGPAPEEPEETGEGFLDNAGIKALHYHAATGLPALAEDSGLEVDALAGGPGVRSARWLGKQTPYSQKNRRLIEIVDEWMTEAPGRGRGARYRSATALALDGRIVFRSAGVVEGTITRAPRGDGGFGYDPVFFVPELGRTMAELTVAEKQEISHRGRALAPVRRFLKAALSTLWPVPAGALPGELS